MGATYFGVIESTKKWIEETHPNLGGHWAHFIAGAVGKSLSYMIPVLLVDGILFILHTLSSFGMCHSPKARHFVIVAYLSFISYKD